MVYGLLFMIWFVNISTNFKVWLLGSLNVLDLRAKIKKHINVCLMNIHQTLFVEK